MTEQYDFLLSRKNGMTIGNIRWFVDIDEYGRGRLDGDAAAIAHLQDTIARAVRENWEAYPQPDTVSVTDPLNSFYEMMIVLERGGYAVPEAFYSHTPAGWAERAEDDDIPSDGKYFVCY